MSIDLGDKLQLISELHACFYANRLYVDEYYYDIGFKLHQGMHGALYVAIKGDLCYSAMRYLSS